MKRAKLLVLLGAACCALLPLTAKVTAEYAFEMNIDETLKDLSGMENHPETALTEGAFIKDDMQAARFGKAGDSVLVPVRAFPGNRGSVEMIVRHENPGTAHVQYLFAVYSVKGDGLYIGSRKGKLFCSYYDRSAKKWYATAPGKALPRGKYAAITATWDLPGVIKFYINGEPAGAVNVPVDGVDFKKDSIVTIGSNQQKKNNFAGAVNRFKMTDTPTAPVKVKAPKLQEEVFDVKLGGFDFKFTRHTLGLRGMRFNNVEYISPLHAEPIWSLRVRDNDKKNYFRVDAAGQAAVSWKKLSDKVLELCWHDVALAGGGKTDVRATVGLSADNTLNWQLQVAELPGNLSVDKVDFPNLSCAPTAADMKKMFLTYPQAYGANKPDPFTFNKPNSGLRYGNVYPGGAHMQFGYLYGENVPGILFHAADPVGHYKEFLWTAYPENQALVFNLSQFPARRGISKSFKSAYPFYTVIMPGDWYDAAKYYRSWALKQPWCEIGSLAERKDLPAWLYDSHIAVRPSTLPSFPWSSAKAAALIPLNMKNWRKLVQEVDCGGVSIWYNYNCADSQDSVLSEKKWMSGFNGRSENISIPGIREAVAEMAAKKYYNLGYINSRIYDASLQSDHPETRKLVPEVMLDINGGFQKYGKVVYDTCRASDVWRKHLLDLIRRDSLQNGFAGMYLDSFGRGQYHCFSTNHDHESGCNITSVQGQRKMAKLIRGEMRKHIPGFIISSEASIEQFVDLIDLKLHHHNIFTDSVPLWTAVYHDYQFVYGRTVSRPQIQTTACFHIGALLGRIFTSNSGYEKSYFPEGIYAYYRKLVAMRKHFYSQIGIGEMLRPPKVKCSTPAKNISLKGYRFMLDPVTASAWRNADGVPVAFFTNHTGKAEKFSFMLDEKEFTGKPKRWLIADDNGVLHPQEYNGNSIELPPLGVAALEY